LASTLHLDAAAAARQASPDAGVSWHQRSIKETHSHLGARREGLSTLEVEQRRAQHGANVLE
jgi:hypothetical protein